MSIRDKYKQLDPECRKQLKLLAKHFEKEPKLLSSVKELRPRDDKERKYALYLAIKNLPMMDILNNKALYKYLYCYNTKKDSPNGDFKFIDQITAGDHVCLISGYVTLGERKTKIPAVCKYYKSTKRDIDYEINCYKRLAATGCEIPWMSGSYNLLGHKVMIIERLHSIDKTDRPEDIGKDVLKQLEYLHTFGVHCDLKPGNIMVRRGDYTSYVSDPNNCYKYMIIDHGGTAIEPLGRGYRRFIWNPRFTSTIKGEKNQVCSAYNDFLELGYTMNWLDADRKGVDTKKYDHRKEFHGRFRKYMAVLEEYKDNQFDLPKDIYHRLLMALESGKREKQE